MKFKIGFDKRDKKIIIDYWNEVYDSQQWSEGPFTEKFEEKWSAYNSRQSISFSSWGGAALAALEFFDVKGKTDLGLANILFAS